MSERHADSPPPPTPAPANHVHAQRLLPTPARVGLVVWIVVGGLWAIHIGFALPSTYTALRWNVAWFGLDIAQVVAVLGALTFSFRRHRYTILFVTSAGVLLLIDAWFDIVTARNASLTQSILSAGLEIPLGLAMLFLAARTLRDLTSAPTDSANPDPSPSNDHSPN